MDALSKIRSKINDFPGYGSEADIITCDEEVRAYVGERLAELAERLKPERADAPDVLQPVILRAAFANQRAVAPLEWSRASIEGSGLLDADAALIDLGDEASNKSAADLDDYVKRVAAAFDTRDASLMRAGIALR